MSPSSRSMRRHLLLINLSVMALCFDEMTRNGSQGLKKPFLSLHEIISP